MEFFLPDIGATPRLWRVMGPMYKDRKKLWIRVTQTIGPLRRDHGRSEVKLRGGSFVGFGQAAQERMTVHIEGDHHVVGHDLAGDQISIHHHQL